MGNAPDLIPTAEAAKILRRSVATVNRYAAAGDLKPALELGGRTGARLFHRADVEALAAKFATRTEEASA